MGVARLKISSELARSGRLLRPAQPLKVKRVLAPSTISTHRAGIPTNRVVLSTGSSPRRKVSHANHPHNRSPGAASSVTTAAPTGPRHALHRSLI
jgi:hypothetical protein